MYINNFESLLGPNQTPENIGLHPQYSGLKKSKSAKNVFWCKLCFTKIVERIIKELISKEKVWLPWTIQYGHQKVDSCWPWLEIPWIMTLVSSCYGCKSQNNHNPKKVVLDLYFHKEGYIMLRRNTKENTLSLKCFSQVCIAVGYGRITTCCI